MVPGHVARIIRSFGAAARGDRGYGAGRISLPRKWEKGATNWYAQAEHGGFYQAVADPHLSQRGYVTSEPFSIEKGA